jgi:hypothetical protein
VGDGHFYDHKIMYKKRWRKMIQENIWQGKITNHENKYDRNIYVCKKEKKMTEHFLFISTYLYTLILYIFL